MRLLRHSKDPAPEGVASAEGSSQSSSPDSAPPFFRKLRDRFRAAPPTELEKAEQLAAILESIVERKPLRTKRQARARRKAMLGRKVHRAQLIAARKR